MKTIKLSLFQISLIVLLVCFDENHVYSLDSLKVNESYKILLMDESSLEGKVIEVDSNYIDLINDNEDVMHIKKSEIKRIIKDNEIKYLFSASFQYGILSFSNDSPYEQASKNPLGFCLSVSFHLKNNLWLKPEYAYFTSTNIDPYNYYGSSSEESMTEHHINIMIGYQNLKNDVLISPIIFGGLGLTFRNESYTYSDLYFNNVDSYSNNSLNIIIEGGLSVRVYKGLLLYSQIGFGISIIPLMFGNQQYIPIKIGASYGL